VKTIEKDFLSNYAFDKIENRILDAENYLEGSSYWHPFSAIIGPYRTILIIRDYDNGMMLYQWMRKQYPIDINILQNLRTQNLQELIFPPIKIKRVTHQYVDVKSLILWYFFFFVLTGAGLCEANFSKLLIIQLIVTRVCEKAKWHNAANSFHCSNLGPQSCQTPKTMTNILLKKQN